MSIEGDQAFRGAAGRGRNAQPSCIELPRRELAEILAAPAHRENRRVTIRVSQTLEDHGVPIRRPMGLGVLVDTVDAGRREPPDALASRRPDI